MMVRFLNTMLKTALLATALFATTACEGYNDEFEGRDPFANAAVQPSGTEAAVLMLLNDEGTTHSTLDAEAGIDKRAASNLINHRNGYDGLYGTDDDRLFGSLREVDEIKWVGPTTLDRLAEYARGMGYMNR